MSLGSLYSAAGNRASRNTVGLAPGDAALPMLEWLAVAPLAAALGTQCPGFR